MLEMRFLRIAIPTTFGHRLLKNQREASLRLSLPLEGKAAIREYHLLKKGGEAATSALNPEP